MNYTTQQIRELHEKAMELRTKWHASLNAGDAAGDHSAELMPKNYMEQAYQLEREAVQSLLLRHDLEPTRSILIKTCAILALENGLYEEAEQLATIGLEGNPGEFASSEMQQILERAKRGRG